MEFIDLNKKYDINNIIIKDNIYKTNYPEYNDLYEANMQLIKYIPNTLLEDFKIKYRKKIKKLRKKKESISIKKIVKEPIYNGYNSYFNVKTYKYIKSPFNNDIMINNIKLKCIKWNLYRPKKEVTVVIEDKNNNKYKHILKYEDFRKLLLNEFPEHIVEDYLCS
jgi:hypothetical protein